MDDVVAFFAFGAALSVFALMYARNFVAVLILLLLVLQPLSNVGFIPRGLFGVTGTNPTNVIWLALFAVLALEQVGRRSGIALTPFFSVPICAFFLLFLVAVIRSATDMASFYFISSSLVGKSSAYFIVQELVKPIQILLTGWMVWTYCRLQGDDEIVRVALLAIPIILAPIVLAYFLSGTIAGGYMRGREMVSSSMGMHANAIGAFSVYLLAFALFSSSSGRKLLRGWTIASSILIIILSFSRMAFLATAVISIFGYTRISKRERQILIVALAVVMAVFFAELASRVRFGLGDNPPETGGVSAGRVNNIWLPLLPQVLEHPIVGEGILTIRKSEAARQGLAVRHPHNAYLEVLLDMGIVGLLSLAFVLYWFMALSGGRPEFRFALVGWLAMGITGSSFYPSSANFPIWIIYALALFDSGSKRPDASVTADLESPSAPPSAEKRPVQIGAHKPGT